MRLVRVLVLSVLFSSPALAQIASTQADWIWKKAQNKAFTSVNKAFYEELSGGFLVWGQDVFVPRTAIPATPPGGDTAEIDVVSSLALVADTSVGSSLTWCALSSGSSCITGTRAGDWIEPRFGAGYTVVIVDNVGKALNLNSGATGWFFDYKTGNLLLSATPTTMLCGSPAVACTAPFFLTAYRYIGPTVAAGEWITPDMIESSGQVDGDVLTWHTGDAVSWDAPSVSNSFSIIDTSSGTNPEADTATDTLILSGTAPIVVTGDSSADSATVSFTTPGSDTQVIFNDGGVPGADDALILNKTTDEVTSRARFNVNFGRAAQEGLHLFGQSGSPSTGRGGLMAWYFNSTLKGYTWVDTSGNVAFGTAKATSNGSASADGSTARLNLSTGNWTMGPASLSVISNGVAGDGPSFTMRHDNTGSATSGSESAGGFVFQAEDSTGATTTYADITGIAVNVNNTFEEGSVVIKGVVAGVSSTPMAIIAGDGVNIGDNANTDRCLIRNNRSSTDSCVVAWDESPGEYDLTGDLHISDDLEIDDDLTVTGDLIADLDIPSPVELNGGKYAQFSEIVFWNGTADDYFYETSGNTAFFYHPRGRNMARPGSIVDIACLCELSAFVVPVSGGDFACESRIGGATVFGTTLTGFTTVNDIKQNQATQARGVDTFAAGDVLTYYGNNTGINATAVQMQCSISVGVIYND